MVLIKFARMDLFRKKEGENRDINVVMKIAGISLVRVQFQEGNPMPNDMNELKEFIKGNTIRNRDDMIFVYSKYSSKDLVLILIETMKKYSQNEDVLTGQYMMTLDAIQKVLEKRKFITTTNTWTLEEFLNDIPFHSDIIEED